jgi:ferritin-like metal-binding protein YciE
MDKQFLLLTYRLLFFYLLKISRFRFLMPASVTKHGRISYKEKAMKTLEDLFLHQLKDIYYAERQILKTLPKMAKTVSALELRQAFEKHKLETEGQVERLEEIFKMLDQNPEGEKCAAILGLVEEGNDILNKAKNTVVIDAGLLAGAQAIEHYEIARYGTLIAWATRIGMSKAIPLLKETLEQEKKTDRILTQLAETSVNKQAA